VATFPWTEWQKSVEYALLRIGLNVRLPAQAFRLDRLHDRVMLTTRERLILRVRPVLINNVLAYQGEVIGIRGMRDAIRIHKQRT
jgi:hypothetical protein